MKRFKSSSIVSKKCFLINPLIRKSWRLRKIGRLEAKANGVEELIDDDNGSDDLIDAAVADSCEDPSSSSSADAVNIYTSHNARV
jgi:hypothetical protein